MATPAGATMRDYGRCPEYSEIFPAVPTVPFDIGRSISDGLRTDVDRIRPQRSGLVLSWPPDSGIGLSVDGRTQGRGVGRFGHSDGSEGLQAG